MIAADMAKSGYWTQQEVENGIREASPVIESRKADHIENYASAPSERRGRCRGVQAHRKEHARQAQRGGPGQSKTFPCLVGDVCPVNDQKLVRYFCVICKGQRKRLPEASP